MYARNTPTSHLRATIDQIVSLYKLFELSEEGNIENSESMSICMQLFEHLYFLMCISYIDIYC